jgi:hypothetical protein
MAMGGVGAGGQFGAELTDFVFVLTTDAAVKAFMQAGSLTLGGNISMAVGPIGRSAEAGGVMGVKTATGVFAYSKTRGLYGGLTVEGGVLAERAAANKKLYGRRIRARELLTGLIPSPPEAEVLMTVLNGDFFQFESSAQSTTDSTQPPEQSAENSTQSPIEQPQQIAASNPVTMTAAEETPEVAESSAEVTHDVRETHTPETTTPTVQRLSAAELETDHAPRDTEIFNDTTHDAPKSNTRETVATAGHASAAEMPADPAPQREPISESTPRTSHRSPSQHVSPDSQNGEHAPQVEESGNDGIPHESDTQQPKLAADSVPANPSHPPK